ncbi:uncharacterized protein LOC133830976 isoform X1 [Humulus lupulus]|uniref:uncharacterized protein LOC133830976 isoform X1 n=1 Tax=Humulus lupulus TaxID=3486 RepID=UPI002B410656|nr:uncharacterized protein LOC133830976 isoform X1 [Humulus lupulus]
MKEHTVYFKKLPHLKLFLDRVAEMFEVIIFTASQSIYAEHLLDILDPDGNIIFWHVYRESCIFSAGSYTKDLTILDIDLAKVAIVDNSPQVFRLQVNNGIPIKSWFDDPSDCALISLLPFLETLVDADDVIGTTLNYFLDNRINRAEILFPSVGCFWVAVCLASTVHSSNAADNKEKLEGFSSKEGIQLGNK